MTDSQATSMTVEQLRTWLHDWVARTAGLESSEVGDDRPLESFGLSSRDMVLLSGELENLLGVHLDATIAYEYPTIDGLAQKLIENAQTGAQTGAQAGAQANTGLSNDHGTHSAHAPHQRTRAEHDIAIVGMAARFPGADNLEEMWSMLVEGRDAVGPLPAGRWSEYADDQVMVDKMANVNTDGGYLQDIAGFDAEFFGLAPVEAANMDPQQRIMLELSWKSLEHAGIAPNTLRGKPVGVYFGSTNNDYGMLITADPAEAHPYALTGTASSIIPNRVSYAFDFRGPSVSVDTACSSSLVAVHHAVRALRDGDADLALSGGVNILASPFISTAFGELGVISPTSAIHAFSDEADGFVRGDGAGVLVLKRVADALRDGDTIHAVIRGSAVNSDGHSNGLTAPNPEAQVDVLQRAYRDAGIRPQEVDYVEAHGTGTILGDPIEATALGEVLGKGRDITEPTLLGSIKTNIGHTEAAAGTAGLIKVVLGLQHDIIPPSLHFDAPNRFIDFDAERLEVVEDPREWPQYSGRRVAGVSGFGFGGTNAHIVLSDFNAADYDVHATQIDAQLAKDNLVSLPVSGLLPSRRRQLAEVLAGDLEQRPEEELIPFARALSGRNHGRSRAIIHADSIEQAVKRLRQVAEGKVSVGIDAADSPASLGPVFVYSGFGSQHRKMVKDLCELSPIFRKRLEELDELVEFESGWSILEIVRDDEQTYDTETAQVAITAIQIALTDLLATFGARPAAVMGMSMGEIAAAYAAGGLSAEDALRVACHRARLMGEGEQSLPEDELGAMAVIEISADDLAQLREERPEYAGIEPAVYAGPGMTTVGGPRDAVVALVEEWEKESRFARLLNVKGAGHTSAVDPLLGELAAETGDVQPTPLRIPLFSSVDCGTVYQPGSTVHDSDYWIRCTRQAVHFQEATEAAFAAGHSTLVEISPNPVALMAMMNTAFAVGRPDAQLLYALKRKVDTAHSMRELLGKLYVQGQDIDFRFFNGDEQTPITPVPGVAFRHQSYWTDAHPSSTTRVGLPGVRTILPDRCIAFRTTADLAPSVLAVLEAAAENIDPTATLSAYQEHGTLPPSGELTTIVRRVLGGLSLSVHHVTDNDDTVLIAEGFATAGDIQTQAPAELGYTAPTERPSMPTDEVQVEQRHWDPASGESVEDRMRAIVSESMGYDVDDLPRELPLIDLGLDSLMGMRIKNRIENDFQIPPLQIQALRDASVADVVSMVEDMVAQESSAIPENESPHSAAPAPAQAAPVDAAASPQRESADNKPSAPSTGVGVAPRDASERLVFATWAGITGAAAAGVTSQLPSVDEETAQKIAERLNERAGASLSAADILAASTLEPLADQVRETLETDVEGNIRVLRAREEGSTKPSVFLFHPAGGSSVVYQPLMRRLPDDVPVYGVERLEGSLAERAAAYLPDIQRLADGKPVVLGGWSFGGALAYEVAHQLEESDVEVGLIVLLDTVQPSETVPDTIEETKARWERYAAFAEKTYGLEFPVPYELLETAGEDALLGMLVDFLATTDPAEHGLAAGVLEHQRASFVDNRILDRMDLRRWADVRVPVMLFRAERMHDGAIELEPRYAQIDPDGGWSAIVDQLDIIQLHGDHLAVVDEPEIATVGAHLTKRIEEMGSTGPQS